MSIMVGVGRGAQAGVLIKNAEALERFEKVDTLVVDKTGTLTEGKPRRGAVARRRASIAEALLRLAASLERGSEHPLAAAIVAAATESGLALARPRISTRRAGKGVRRQGRRRRDRHRQRRFLGEHRDRRRRAWPRGRSLRRDGATAMFVAVDGKPAGILGDRRSDQGDDARRRSRASAPRASGW